MENLYFVLIALVIVIGLCWFFVKKKAKRQHTLRNYHSIPAQKRYAKRDIESYIYAIIFSALFISLILIVVIHEFPSHTEGAVTEEETIAPLEETVEKSPAITAELPAEYPGGQAALMKYVYENFNYFQRDIDNGTQGMIYVKFIIEKDGSMSDVKILKGINQRLDHEAIRVIKSLPKWKPARKEGSPVRMYFNLPIKLKIK